MLPISIKIDSSLCNTCGLCVKVCPARALTVINESAKLTGECEFACDHCAAVCPEAAITLELSDTEEFALHKFSQEFKPGPPPLDPAGLVSLMRSRRSCRNFKEQPVSRELLADLVKIATTAPSGTNSQKWTFSVIDQRARVLEFGTEIAGFFNRLNRLATSTWLRKTLKLCGRPELDLYFREYYESIKEGLDLWYNQQEDRLFHGAPALILVGAEPGASCPQDDALLATQNILLAAESIGLGTCLIGFAVEALHRDRKIQKTLKIPLSEKIYSVIALGHPQITFQRPALRKKVDIHWITR